MRLEAGVYRFLKWELKLKYLSQNKDKVCKEGSAVFKMDEYREFKNTKVKHLSQDEVEKYLSER